MIYKKTHICPRGHDTSICGRNTEWRCRLCSRADSLKWYKSQPLILKRLRQRKSNLKKFYGLTLEQYNWYFNNQKGNCLGCQINQDDLKRRLNVDHNHSTDKIRGLLCTKCNHVIGLVNENVNTLLNLAKYLKENN